MKKIFIYLIYFEEIWIGFVQKDLKRVLTLYVCTIRKIYSEKISTGINI